MGVRPLYKNDLMQSASQIGSAVCLYTVLPDFQQKNLLIRAEEWLKLWVWHKIKSGLVLEFCDLELALLISWAGFTKWWGGFAKKPLVMLYIPKFTDGTPNLGCTLILRIKASYKKALALTSKKRCLKLRTP